MIFSLPRRQSCRVGAVVVVLHRPGRVPARPQLQGRRRREEGRRPGEPLVAGAAGVGQGGGSSRTPQVVVKRAAPLAGLTSAHGPDTGSDEPWGAATLLP